MRRTEQEPTPAPAPAPTPTPAPAPSPTPAPQNLYLPHHFPNPYGFYATQTCQPGYQQTYGAAGYYCAFTHTATFWTNGNPSLPYTAKVYQLFGVWYCNGQLTYRCD